MVRRERKHFIDRKRSPEICYIFLKEGEKNLSVLFVYALKNLWKDMSR